MMVVSGLVPPEDDEAAHGTALLLRLSWPAWLVSHLCNADPFLYCDKLIDNKNSSVSYNDRLSVDSEEQLVETPVIAQRPYPRPGVAAEYVAIDGRMPPF